MTSIIRTIAAASLLFAGAAKADIKIHGDNGDEFTIHSATIQYATVEKIDIAEALITSRANNGNASRKTWVFANCGGPVGKAARIDEGKIVEKMTWVAGGDSVIDLLAGNTCSLAYIREVGDLLKELEKTSRAPKKNI
jgi:hypothetical protein